MPGLDHAATQTSDLLSAPSMAQPATPPVTPSAVPSFRQFGDNTVTRRMIFENVLAAAQKLEPASNPRHSLGIENTRWQGPEDYSIAEQKQAVLSRGTLGRKLVGDFVLRDAVGDVIAKRSAQLARVPYMTDRGTFIMGGNEYTMAHQMRLRPGVFTRRKQNGELESHVNVSKGFSHRVFMDPKTGVFRIAIGQAKIPIVPVLKSMGITDRQMQEAWGNELSQSNMQHSDPQAVGKLYKKLFQHGTAAAGQEQHLAVAQAFHDMTLDPEVTKRTLGKPFSNVTPDTLLEVTKKLLRVNNGEDEPDDRDAMAYQHMMGPEDLFAERLQKAKGVARQLLWKASAKGNLDSISSGAYDESIRAALMGSGLGMPLEEINPADIFDQQARVTRMGEGGIPSLDAVPDEARSVQPSQFGFIDFLRTPECYDFETEVMTRQGWKCWPAVVATDELACQVDGRLEYHVPHKLHCYPYVGELCGVDTGRIRYLITPNHRVWVRSFHKTATYHFEDADRVKNFRKVQSGGFLPYIGSDESVFRLPKVAIAHNPQQVAKSITLNIVDSIDIDDWAEFMGWWLGEGSSCYKESDGNGNVLYRVRISQSLDANPANYAQIDLLLSRLPFKSYKDSDNNGFTLPGKQLTAYLQQFGRSHERHIPEALLRSRISARRRLFEALLLAEGRRDRRDVRTQFCTTSRQLATDFQRLAFSLGYSTQYAWEPDDREQSNHGGAHIIHVHKINEHPVHTKRSPSQGGYSDHYRQVYNDNVYCATVPGELLYVRRQNGIGHWSGNSGKVGVDARLARAAVKGKDGNIYTPVRDMKTGEIVYKTPQELADASVGFPGESKNGNNYGAALQGGKVRMIPQDKIDYEVPDMESTFSPLGNMIPFKSMVKGQRAVMAARMITQALPLTNAEAPYVQSGVPGEDGMSFEEKYGKHMGAIRAEAPARVVSMDNDSIVLADQDGKQKTVQLYNNFPYNRKTFIHQTPTVKPGDVVQPGQLLARSNFTDAKGVTALGLNARVAYVPWGGLNFEDANLVSESFAKRASSEHMYQHQHEWESGDHQGRNAFVSIFPSTYDRKKLENFDQDGVVKPGTVIRHGDPLILIAREKERNRKSLLKGTKPSFQDATKTWDHENEGVVTDVVKTGKGTSVVVKSLMPMQVGDKLCFDEDTEVLTQDGWKNVAILTLTDQICTLQSHDCIVYMPAEALHYYATGGAMYRIKSQQIDQFVTINHRQYVQKRNADTFTLERAIDIFGTRCSYKKDGLWHGRSPAVVVIDGPVVKAGQAGNGSRKLPDVQLTIQAYLTLLGAFISEGNVVDQPKSGSYGIDITQIKQPNRNRLLRELSQLGIKYSNHGVGTKLRIYSKALLRHFERFGKSAGEKHLPRDVFTWAATDLRTLFNWLMWGDGHYHATGRAVCYTTTSPRLADDMQQLCLHIGYAANVVNDLPATVQVIKGKTYNCLPRYNCRIITTKLTPTVNHGHVHKQHAQEEYIIQDYDRPVYCVTVPGHVLYVRRNGKACWSGNSGRYGDKGVISHIIPDDQMPAGPDGRPFEVLLNPLGVISRTNPAQIVEAALGKVAEMRKEGYRIPDFQNEEDMVEFAMKELQKHGVSDTDTITDPVTGRAIPDVFTGNRWFMKLHHTSESKGQGRGLGSYTAEMTPAKGGPEGAKRIGMLETNALLSHGATEFLRSSHLVRGQSNPQFWAQYMSGFKPPTPSVPHVYHKFVNNLRASGINVLREGTRTHIMALTDKDIDSMAGDRELRNADTVDWRNMEPLPGGLFDKALTGGHASSDGGGNRWSFIRLHEPLPNPAMEEPIRRVLGITSNKFADIMSGKERLDGQTGPGAISSALRKINVDTAIDQARADIQSGKKTSRDAAVRRLGYLKNAKRLGIHPGEWVIAKAPVLPPAFRPVSTMGPNKLPLVADPNYLYKELFDANKSLKDLRGQLDDTDLGDERFAVYSALKAVTGLGDPTHPKNQERQVKGILKHVFGSSPKLGTVQRRLLGATTDLVGRAVIAPDPDLDMDQVGIPENQAWDIYRPVLIRGLVRRGMPRMQAARAVEDRSQVARKALLDEMDSGVVVINRAPTLHKYGMMAARPRLVKGNVLKISPLVVSGFGADFDGDAMQYHVPIGDEEKQEALDKMLPSRNLLSAASFKVNYTPSQEYVGGLYESSARVDHNKPALTFATAADAVRAYHQGRIGVGRRVEILDR